MSVDQSNQNGGNQFKSVLAAIPGWAMAIAVIVVAFLLYMVYDFARYKPFDFTTRGNAIQYCIDNTGNTDHAPNWIGRCVEEYEERVRLDREAGDLGETIRYCRERSTSGDAVRCMEQYMERVNGVLKDRR